jgi:hypothetical protein
MPPPQEKWLFSEFIVYSVFGVVMAIPTSYLIAWLLAFHLHWWTVPTVMLLGSVALCGIGVIIACIRRAMNGGVEDAQI